MNTLSWLLYAADVIPGIGIFLITSGALIAVGCVVGFIVGCITVGDASLGHNRDRRDEMLARGRSVRSAAVKLVFVAPIAVLLGLAIPGKSTIYMIAASEMGETVVTNPEVREIYDAMKAKVRDYLEIDEESAK